MSTRRLCTCSLITLLLILVGATSWAQDQGTEFQWKGKVPAEGVIEIKNVNGDIEAELATGDQVEVTAEKTGPHADEVKIEVVQHSDGVTICAIYPGWFSGRCDSWHGSSHNDRTKVHFTVKVPENVRFYAQNVNGSLRARDMGRFVKASSVNGSVRVSTKSWAEISSVNGSLEARMGRSDWSGTLKAESVNGSITLELPSDTNAEVDFKSVNGRLESDFPLTVQGSLGGHVLRGKIGSGGRELKVETVNGNVNIRRNSV
jgi:putative adhesin